MRNLYLLAGMAVASCLGLQAQNVPMAHAYQMGSQDNKWGFVEFPVDNVDALRITHAVSSSDAQVGAGECVNGKYYSYTLTFDMLMGSGLEPWEYVVWDMSDYSKVKVLDAPYGGRVVDMAYDYTTNTMYALREINRADNGAIGLTALNVVDLETGALTLIGLPGELKTVDGYNRPVEEHLVALASSPSDGQLYAMGEYRQLYKVDRFSGLATAVGTRNRLAITNDFQTMAFSADGNLYYALCHPDYEYFVQVDPVTAALSNPVTGQPVTIGSDFSNNAARMPGDGQISGLWFDGKTYVQNVPAKVSALAASVGQSDWNSVTLTWQLPTLNADGSAASVTGVTVYRLGTAEPIATLGPTATTFTDDAAPNGDVSYMVVADCASGAGLPAWTTVFAGADQLKAVTDLQAELDGEDALLTWNAPTETVNGGRADYSNITYTVVRVMGSIETVLTEEATGTSYTAALDGPGTYHFIVTPASDGVTGLSAQSGEVTLEASSAAPLPYDCGFEDNDGGTLWTIVNSPTSTSSYGWSIIKGYAYQQLSGKFAQFKTGGSATIPADDWFISPAIQCPAGQYKLSFMANGGSYDTHSYAVYAGPDSTLPSYFTQKVYELTDQKVYGETDENNHYVLVEVEFDLAESGPQRVAFQGIGAATYATLKIDNFHLECIYAVGVEMPGDVEAAPRYFTLQGTPASADAKGVLIKVTGGNAVKVKR